MPQMFGITPLTPTMSVIRTCGEYTHKVTVHTVVCIEENIRPKQENHKEGALLVSMILMMSDSTGHS